MSAEIEEILGQLITCKVTGRLTQAELKTLQRQVAPLLQGKVRLLIVAEDFVGWERGGEWADFSFQEQNDAHIERMALVGDKKWEELIEAFVGKGLRDFPIAYFEPGEMQRAFRWLSEK